MAGLWSNMLVCLIAYNVPCGPWADDARYHQCKEALAHLFDHHSPQGCPLYLNMLDEFLMEAKQENQLKADDEVEESIWLDLQIHSPWLLKGDKVVVNRFMGARRKAATEVQHWCKRSFAYQYVCLEMDFFQGAKFIKIAAGKDNDDENGGSTSAKKLCSYEKKLRGACRNCMVIAALVFGDYENCIRQKIIAKATDMIDDWHSEQSKACRSTEGTKKFLKEQLSGGFLKVMSDTFQVLSSPSNLEYMSFVVPIPGTPLHLDLLEEGYRAVQDSFAGTAGMLVLALVGFRLKRMAFMLRGWPHRSAACLMPGKGQTILDEFKQDAEAFAHFQGLTHLPGIQHLVDRSLFQDVATKQLLAICKQEDWTYTFVCRSGC